MKSLQKTLEYKVINFKLGKKLAIDFISPELQDRVPAESKDSWGNSKDEDTRQQLRILKIESNKVMGSEDRKNGKQQTKARSKASKLWCDGLKDIEHSKAWQGQNKKQFFFSSFLFHHPTTISNGMNWWLTWSKDVTKRCSKSSSKESHKLGDSRRQGQVVHHIHHIRYWRRFSVPRMGSSRFCGPALCSVGLTPASTLSFSISEMAWSGVLPTTASRS